MTSAIAAPAYAGIPVTHRDAASSFAIITGHERDDSRESGTRAPGDAEGRRRWDKIAGAGDTLLFLMGVENLDEIASQLQAHGRRSETPVALVRWGTWAGQQETLVGTLGDIVEKVRAAKFKAPAVTIIGEVVKLREKLRWFDVGPLFGKSIVVTRAREQASEFAEKLAAKGAEAIVFPLIKIVPPSDGYQALDDAVIKIGTYDWLCFASAPAVHAFCTRLAHAGKDARAFSTALIAAVGPATAEALRSYGLCPDFQPSVMTGAGLGAELPGEVFGKNILVPRARDGEEGLMDTLTAREGTLDAVVAYENVLDGADAGAIRQRFLDGTIDAVTFTSSSTVKNFADALPDLAFPQSVAIACIGPSTAIAVENTLGRTPDIVAEEPTMGALIAALEKWYGATDSAALATERASAAAG